MSLMLKDYICECGNETEYKKEYGVDFPQTIKCEKCGKDMKINYGSKRAFAAVTIPEWMKSATGFKY